MNRILPLLLTFMLLLAGCTSIVEPEIVLPSEEPTPLPANTESAGHLAADYQAILSPTIEPSPVETSGTPDPGASAEEAVKILRPVEPKQQSVPSSKPQIKHEPRATTEAMLELPEETIQTIPTDSLELMVPELVVTLEPATSPEPTVNPEPAATPEPVPTEQAAGYTDSTNLRAAFMDAINTEKAANGAVSGSLDAGLCAIAQDRARQMAEAGQAAHIGSGYPETAGSMSSARGVTNKGRNSVHHCPDLMGCTNFGIGLPKRRMGFITTQLLGSDVR